MPDDHIPPHRAAAAPPVHAVTTQDGVLIDDGRELDPATVLPRPKPEPTATDTTPAEDQ
jgi:hypothetical protein